MRATLALAGLTLLGLLAVGCESGSGGGDRVYRTYHNEWDPSESGNRYDYQYRSARPAGGAIEPNYENQYGNEGR